MIIETDIGRDPDDFFSIAWLMENNYKIDAITITPGDPDQIAVARLLCKIYGVNIPIGVPNLDRNKRSSGGVHYKLLDKYKMPKEAKADGVGADILGSLSTSEFVILGPCTNIGSWLEEKNPYITTATMQGGFLPNDNPKFLKMESCGTFNLNGDRKAADIFLRHTINRRQMCGKNVCHFVVLDENKANMFDGFLGELARMYTYGGNTKAMHDLVAVICHKCNNIGTWVKGKTYYAGQAKWTTNLDLQEDFILENIQHEAFWKIASGRIG